MAQSKRERVRNMSNSNVARVKQQIQREYDAAQQALYGFAAVATHASINARMERGAKHLLALCAEGKHEEVMRLMETAAWGIEEE